jgi:hypothetical protein
MAEDEKKVSTHNATGKKITTTTEAREALARYLSTGNPPPTWVARFLSTGDLSTIPEWARKEFDATGKKITTHCGTGTRITTGAVGPRLCAATETREAFNVVASVLSTGPIPGLPEWARKEYVEAIDKANSLKVPSWDALVGPLLEKGKWLEVERRRREQPKRILARLRELKAAGESINKATYRRVAKEKEFITNATEVGEIWSRDGTMN